MTATYVGSPNHVETVDRAIQIGLDAGFTKSKISAEDLRMHLEYGVYEEDYAIKPGVPGTHFPLPRSKEPNFSLGGQFPFSRIPYGVLPSFTNSSRSSSRSFMSSTDATMKRILSALVLLALVVPLTGCSVIGLAIGAGEDDRASSEFRQLTTLDELSTGSSVTLVTTHGDTLKGELVGLKEIREYDKIYHEKVSGTPLGDVVPATQAQVTVVAHEKAQLMGAREKRFRAKVLAFDPGVVRLMPVTSGYSPVLHLSALDSLVSDGGHSIDSATLNAMIRESRVPFISEVGIVSPQDTLWLPADEISLILHESSSNGAVKGLIIGAAVDVAVYFLVLRNVRVGLSGKWTF